MSDHRILVCGSRDWGDEDAIADRLADLTPDHPTILHGAASRIVDGEERSADMLADRVARLYGFDVEMFPADWGKHGRYAGFHRNLRMLDECPDLVIAFHKNGSRGTQHTIDEARKRGIRVEVHTAGASS